MRVEHHDMGDILIETVQQMLDFVGRILVRVLAPRLLDLELFDSPVFLPALPRPSPVMTRIDHCPVQVTFRILPDIPAEARRRRA